MIFLNILKDKYLRVAAGISLLILVVGCLIVAVKLYNAQDILIIHFNNYSGYSKVDFFGEKLQVFEILALGTVMVLVNSFLADFLYFKERFLAYLFIFGGLGAAILILIVMGVIISVN